MKGDLALGTRRVISEHQPKAKKNATNAADPGPQGPPHQNGLAEGLQAARVIIQELQKAVEGLRAASDLQLRRSADLQAQLDITLGEFRHLQERPSGSLERLGKRN